ncbi:restriction endonuclease subunit S [Ruegeria sp. HKCCD7221]|uniref:restriction endonuclease subunit S n=1 Tax=Ruegeria sp. HKCCD7221 TaxID=2683009 RepID=UPI001487AEAB|nr:restriction endonuclease subunit S [Ruegeria sp. HKCCD7221]
MLDELPSGWKKDKFINFVTLKRGYDLPVSKRVEGAVPVVASNGPVGWHNEAIVRGPVVVTGRSGTIGKVQFYEHDCHPLNTTLYTQDLHGNNPQFVAEFLRHFRLERFATGTGVPTLNRNLVHEVVVAFPPLPEQQCIAEVLASVDDSIRATEAVIEQAERVKGGLIKDLLTGGLGSECVGGGELPEGWRLGKLGDLAKIKNGFAFKSKDFTDETSKSALVVRMSNFNNGPVVFEGCKRIPLEVVESLERFELGDGDILIAMSGATVGKLGIVESPNERVFLNQRVGCVVPNKEACREFLWHFMRTENFAARVFQSATGNAQPNISGKQIESIQIVVPPSDEQAKIAGILSSLDDQVAANRATVVQLETVKRGLMDDLLTGRVRTVK